METGAISRSRTCSRRRRFAADDEKRGGRREIPKLKGEWEELLDNLRDESNGERERGIVHFI